VITTGTYRTRVDPRRDMLAAYSALDHETTAGLTPPQVDAAYARLLARLAVLLFLHGPVVPAAFLEALGTVADDDPVDVTAAFLETGVPPDGQRPVSELQQELVHFSRIVDLGGVGLADEDPEAGRAVRRLRGSHRLPQDLKVLSELVIVTRSRLLARGDDLPTPALRGRAVPGEDIAGAVSLWYAGDCALAAASARRRTRMEAGYLVTALLSYLTPVEAALAVWAHATQSVLRAPLDVLLVATGRNRAVTEVRWSLPAGGGGWAGGDPVAWCRSHLPAVTALARRGQRWEVPGTVVSMAGTPGGRVNVTLSGEGRAFNHHLVLRPVCDDAVPAVWMAERAGRLLTAYSGPDVASIECGHIHLDRDLDADQETGALLGSCALRVLAGRQRCAPALTPMMDDDHVLVRLRPCDYRVFLESRLGRGGMHLVPESSPVVRAVVTALWQRLHRLGLAGRLRQRGGNLFLRLGDGGEFCELFEDYQRGGQPGPAATGCVFFESALLVYRSAPERFDAYFRSRFGLGTGVHEQAAEILSGRGGHDERQARLARFYERFSAVTDPRRPDPEFLAVVDDVLDSVGAGVAHLNVLEDYYEVQQGKVRTLLRMLELAIRLITLHFNKQTGRVVLDG
jgi:hypothetical protein